MFLVQYMRKLRTYVPQVKKSFGLFLKEEKVVWEQWVIPVLVNTSPRPTEDDETSGELEGGGGGGRPKPFL